MNTTIEGEGLNCPHCNNKLTISFDHDLEDEKSDKLINSMCVN